MDYEWDRSAWRINGYSEANIDYLFALARERGKTPIQIKLTNYDISVILDPSYAEPTHSRFTREQFDRSVKEAGRRR